MLGGFPRCDSQKRPIPPYKARRKHPMSALADHAFVKMNGLGNEIVVVDMRAAPAVITPADAQAAAGPGGACPFTKLK